MSRTFRWCFAVACMLIAVPVMVGCGGSDADATVAQAPAPSPAPAATPPADTGSSEEEEPAGESYGGGETYGGGSSGGSSYGGDSSGGDSSGGRRTRNLMSSGMGGGGDSSGEEGSMDSSGSYSTMGPDIGMNEEDGAMTGAGEYSAMMMGPGDGMEGAGMGMPEGYGMGSGMSGMMQGGAAAGGPSFATVTQFLSQNCLNCHSANDPKGDMRLDVLTGDFAATAKQWQQVLAQLESGAMPPASVPRRPNAQQQLLVVSFIKDALESSGVADGQDYLARAKYLFGIGKEAEAIDNFYAHVLTAPDEEAQSLLSNARWFPAGKKPTTTVRFAVGVVLEAPSTLTDLKPLGSNQFGGAGGGGGGGSFGSGGEGGVTRGGPSDGAAGGATQRSFYDLTGDFGQALASQFESRWSAGKLGTVFNDVVAIEAQAQQIGGAAGMGGMGGMAGMAGMAEMGGMEGASSSMGVPSLGPGPGAGAGYGGGGFGAEAGLGRGGGGMGGGGEAAGPRKPIFAGQNITPGLLFVGTGSQQELLEKAVAADVDGIFIYDVEASQNRLNGMINNKTRLRLVLANGDVVAATKTLMNTEVERAAMRGVENELEKNMERLFSKFDEDIRLTDMPPLKPVHAMNRLQQLVNDPQAEQLAVLFETKLYHSLGLVTEGEMSTVFQIVMRGNEGVSLASGSPEDRKLVVEEVFNEL